MEQHFNNNQNEFLWPLLANPANDAHLYAYNLQKLVNDFPQSGILQALLAHASDDKNLGQASVYFNAKSLYKLINAPSTFIGVPDERIIIQTNIGANGHNKEDEQQDAEENSAPGPDENIDNSVNGPSLNSKQVNETEQEKVTGIDDHQPAIGHEADLHLNNASTGGYHADEAVPGIAENTTFKEPVEDKDAEPHKEVIPEAISTLREPELIHNTGAAKEENPESADDNTVAAVVIAADGPGTVESGEHEPTMDMTGAAFDEIVSIGQINIEPETNPWIVADEEIKDERPHTLDAGNGAPEKPVHSNTGPKYPLRSDTDHRDVSKYNDEQMPYTFMWWLDKTRKEHAGTYQPYIQPVTGNSNNTPKKAADELQQQYFENIFHITSIDELDKGDARPAVPFNVKRKEHVIIERFIKEEPQIKPQSSDKLDNENKAKKSSEDRDELVTETLAAIYSDQMLYHKAIASYKKLMLKFPEKSRYFAAKIEQLEKKTN